MLTNNDFREAVTGSEAGTSKNVVGQIPNPHRENSKNIRENERIEQEMPLRIGGKVNKTNINYCL